MKINLYIDNDSRPRGSYENCSHATIAPNGLLHFVTSSGKKFVTGLRYLIEIEEGDKESRGRHFEEHEIVGRPKPKAPKATGQKAMSFVPEKEDDF